MAGFRWIHPGYQALIVHNQLDDLDAVLARTDGEPVKPAHRRRSSTLLTLDAPGHPPRMFYLKRETAVRRRHLARSLLAGRGLWTPARTEFETLRHLGGEGIYCPRPVVCLQRVGFRSQGCLLLEGLPAGHLLSALLCGPLRDQPPATREAFFAQLGQEVARLHDSGVHQPHLYTNHIFVSPPRPRLDQPAADPGAFDPSREIWFLGFRRSAIYKELSLGRRAGDVAALMATIPRRLAEERDRQAFFDAYLSHSQLEHRGMEFIVAVARGIERLLTYRKIWEVRESDTAEHRAVRPLESVQRGKMWIDRRFRPALERAGIARFEAMMATAEGRQLRALPDRENWRIELPHPAGGEGPQACGAYLKKHHVRRFGTWLRARLGAGPGETAGRIEAQNVARLARSGIAAMRLIAYGEQLHDDGLLESFVLTEELVGYTQLDHFLHQRFPPRSTTGPTARDHQLLTLLSEVAAVAAKFHRLGYNHRDLYCCHFFIKEPQRGSFKVNLIDLQRVEHRRHFRWRWLVKDLAQLAYSAPADRISCTHRMAFIKQYLGVRKLRPHDKRLIRQVLAKQRWMERERKGKREKEKDKRIAAPPGLYRQEPQHRGAPTSNAPAPPGHATPREGEAA